MMLSPTNTVITMATEDGQEKTVEESERSHRFGDKIDSLVALDEETRDSLLTS